VAQEAWKVARQQISGTALPGNALCDITLGDPVAQAPALHVQARLAGVACPDHRLYSILQDHVWYGLFSTAESAIPYVMNA
jgi:hypothetical protein